MRYHGNYCGPDWSAGKHQRSVISDVPALDEFDTTCKVHDAAYAGDADLESADYAFAAENLILTDPKRFLAGVGVGIQAVSRSIDRLITTNNINMNKTKQRKSLRGQPQPKQQRAQTSAQQGASLSTVPASYGFSLRMTQPKVTRSANKSSIIGSDFAGTVRTANTASYHPGASIILNPAYFQNAMLGSLARAYEKYRFTKAVVQYIPSVPTSTQGQLVMCSSRAIKEPFLDGSSTTFLSRALSQGNAVATPLWKEEHLAIPCGGEWSTVDALIDADLDDCIQEEIQCYTTCDSSTTAGILMLHYEVEFKDPLYTFHPTLIPVPIGNGSFGALNDNANVNATTSTFILSSATLALNQGDGSIYRMIFRKEASTLPAGVATWAALAKAGSTAATSTTLLNLNTTNIAMTTGTTLYGVMNNSFLILYTSYEGAASGSQTDALYHQTATTTAGTYEFIFALVRLGGVSRIVNQ
jgi:hypothetical protein